jgi:hypothetical protein
MKILAQVVAGIVAIGAGIYLLQYSGGTIDLGNGATGRSWSDIIDHGIGAYFIARGMWMLSHVDDIGELREALNRLVELREWEVAQMVEDEQPEQP